MVKTAPSIPDNKQTYFMPEDLDEPSVLTAIDEPSVVTVKKEGKIRKPDVRRSQPEQQ
jgi:hypothetical protein